MQPTLSPLPVAAGSSAVDAEASGARSAVALLSRLQPGQILALGGTALLLLGFFAYLILRSMEPDYGLLYGNLDLADSGEIVGRLEQLGVPYQLQGDGQTVLVPSDRAARLRMTLAEEGLPSSGTIGNEIFDQASALGTTSFLQNVNLRRALEGELGRTIGALADVKAARVHLVLPQRELFRREQIDATASVTLQMRGARRLEPPQVQAIQHLVAAAVPGLQPDKITIVDNRGTLLSRSSGGGDGVALPSQAEDYRASYEAHLKQVVEQLLERSLGPGRVQAEVTAEIDLDHVTTTEETFDPDGQVARSTQTIEDDSQAAERDANKDVTVGNNLPNTATDNTAGRTNNETSKRTEETVNYEISRTVRNHTQVGGRVKRLSVAVLVDGKMVTKDTGETAYEPLAEAELDELASLVRSAIGFDERRGDLVEIKSMPFAAPPAEPIETGWFDFTAADLMRLAELAVLLILGVLAILLVVRPTLARLLPAAPEPAVGVAGALPAGAGAEGSTGSTGTELAALAPPAGTEGDPAPATGQSTGPAHERVNVERIEGQVRADLIDEARALIDQHADQAALVVRTWLDEDRIGKNG